jgi:Ca2+-binding RTX toxin-like protein
MAEHTPPAQSLPPTGVATPDPRLSAAQEVTGTNPWIVIAKPDTVIEVPFALASASIELRGDDLYVTAGPLLVVIKGYGPALDAGHAPALIDATGDWFAAGVPKITDSTPIVLTDSPLDLPPEPEPDANEKPAAPGKLFGGALLATFELETLAGFRPVSLGGFAHPPSEGHAENLFLAGAIPQFKPLGLALFVPQQTVSAPVLPPFDAVDDKSSVALGAGAGAGNVIAGIGGGVDIQVGGRVTASVGAGAPVAVTASGVDVAGHYGTLHVAADGSVSYQRTAGDVADLATLPNDATDTFTYTLTNGDGRTDSASLTFALMPVTPVTGDTTGTANDEALVLASGAQGTLSGLDGEDRLFGNSGNDRLDGGAGNDYLAPGTGSDQLIGGGGDDTLDLAGNLDATDQIDGGNGTDRLLLDGDYAAGVVFTATTLVDVETIALADGHSYALTLNDAGNAAGLTVDGGNLTGSNTLTLDGSAETGAALTAAGGAGDDVLKGGAGSDDLTGNAGNDTLDAGAGVDTLSGGAGDDVLLLGAYLTAADKIDGGADQDTLQLAGNYAAGVTFGATTVIEVETIRLAAGNSYKLTLDDATNDAGLTVDGAALAVGQAVTLDGSAETAAALTAAGGSGNDALTGGAGNDALSGGAGNDTLTGNAGDDTLTAGGGNDTLSGGAGNDSLVLAGNLTAADKIDGGADNDILQLDGNYAAGVTFTAATMANVETIMVADGNSYKLTLVDANNAGGLTVDGGTLTGGNALTINDAAETRAALVATGGGGNDTLTGGGGTDTLTGNAGDDRLTGGNGDDTLIAGSGTDTLAGGNGDDTLDLGADFDAADKIDGGANTDTLKLDGDYSAGVVFGAATANIEVIAIAAGHDYSLTLANTTNTSSLTVDGSALSSGNRLVLNGAAETSSPLMATGGAGNDVLAGGAGADQIDGGAGDDTITSGAGNDKLLGGAGNDTFMLGANFTAADQIDGGADYDIVKLQGNYASGITLAANTMVNVEEIDLAAGSSYRLTLDDATDTSGLKIDGSGLAAGQVMTINGAAETDAPLIVLGGAGNDALTGGAKDDTLDGGAGNDTLTAGAGEDTLQGGAGNDTIVLAGNLDAGDRLDGGIGLDTVNLNGDYAGLVFAATTMVNVETVTVTAGHSYKLTLDDATNGAGLTVNGATLAATDTLYLDGSAELSAALAATGGAGDDMLIGGNGNDVLAGGSGNDVLTAGGGTDTLSGGNGDDTLDLGADFDAADRVDGGANTDTLKLDGDYSAGVVFGAATATNIEVIAVAAGHDYNLTLANTTNTSALTIDASALGSGNALVLNGAAETTSPLSATGGAGNDVLTGGAGADQIDGGAGDDTITSGAGNDKLLGGAGSDIFILAKNLAAADQIDGGADYDIVKLQGNYAAGITLAADTIVNVEEIDLAAGSSYKLILTDANDSSGLKIDGSGLAVGQTMAISGAAETDAALTMLGGAGNDTLTGGAKDDTLDGGAGNDTLTAGTGEDTVQGGAGNDMIVLAGNLDAGDRIDGGADLDTVNLNGDYAAGVVFSATTVINVETITLTAGNSYRLVLDDATNSAGLTVKGSALVGPNTLLLDGSAELSAALTASGGTGDDTLIGGGGNDVLTGGNGNDTLVAGSGIDTLAGGNGNDTLDLGADLDPADKIDGGANLDTLKLDGDYGAGLVFGATTVVNVETIVVAAGHDYALTLNNATNAAGLTVDGSALGSGNSLTLDGSQETASALTAAGGAGDDSLTGGAGADLLTGGAGNDTLTANAGNDTLSGGGGNDLFVLGANLAAADKIDGGADYDILKLAGNYAAGVTLTATTLVNVEEIDLAAGNSYKLTLNDANDTSTLIIDGSLLAAGQSLTVNGAAETASPLFLLGGAGNDALTGGAGDDTLTGGSGNDTLTAGAGVDTVDGGSGADTIAMAGNLTAADRIDGGADLDTVTLGGNYSAGLTFAATTMVNVETLTLAAGNSYALTLDDATNGAGLTVNANTLAAANFLQLDGSAETGAALTANGGAGSDVLTGGAGSDVLSGGAGNDTLTGNDGDDILTAGAGIDTMSGGAGHDTFVLAANFAATDAIDGGADADTLSLAGNYSSGVTFTATTLVNVETITLADGFSYKFTLNDATNTTGLGVDGSLLSATRALTIDGSAETGAALSVTGGAGNDTLTGGAGGDHLVGGAGNDAIKGNAGIDLLFGGAGDDTLTGGAGADTFTFSLADAGKDKVTDFKLAEGDILEFSNVLDGPGDDIGDLAAAGVTAVGSGGNCVITFNGGASTVTLTGVGGSVASLSDLATLMGPQIHVTH